MSKPSCYLHESVPATDTCQSCLKPICDVCCTIRGTKILCPACAKKLSTRMGIIKTMLGIIALGAIGALIFALVTAEPAFDYGKYSQKIRKLSRQLEAEPCDRVKIIKLGDLMFKAGDYRGVIKRADNFITQCGEYPRLRWITYEAHKSLSEYKQAVSDASLLIKDDPDDKDFWWWRAIAYEQLGKLNEAAADYRQSIAVQPRISNIPFNLSTVLEKLNKPCEAIFPVEQYLYYHPQDRKDPSVQRRLDRLRDAGKCGELTTKGKVEIPLVQGASAFSTMASINSTEGNFLLDTGSTYVVLTREFAQKAGVSTKDSPKILVQTLDGIKTVKLTSADEISLKNLKSKLTSKLVPVAVVENDLGEGVDGLLGLSFLSRLKIVINHKKQTITISR